MGVQRVSSSAAKPRSPRSLALSSPQIKILVSSPRRIGRCFLTKLEQKCFEKARLNMGRIRIMGTTWAFRGPVPPLQAFPPSEASERSRSRNSTLPNTFTPGGRALPVGRSRTSRNLQSAFPAFLTDSTRPYISAGPHPNPSTPPNSSQDPSPPPLRSQTACSFPS